jgi:Glucose / Sorbosone dehydrogenase
VGLVACASFALLTSAPAPGASLEPIGSYEQPVYVASDPTDPDRIFVVEQNGRIRLTAQGQTTTFVDLDPIVLSGGEQGLLSMAFAPNYATSGRFYVFYTGTEDGALHVDELTASGDLADPATRHEVIAIPHPGATNHNGGQLQFGPDGYLYVSTGDGGGSGDPDDNAQDPGTLLGKILRIDPRPGGGYAVPPDNPFGNEVWSYGLRNPWRFSFDRATGDLLIGDVGQGSWEEIDFDPAGAGAGFGDNFGWDCYEGRHSFEPVGCPEIGLTTRPVLEYASGPGAAAVTGGYVVHDPGLTELQGRYVYADFFAGQIRSFVPATPDAVDDRPENLMVENLSSFGEDSCGRVYVASLSGPVYRLVDGTPTECPLPSPQARVGPRLELDGKRKQSIEDTRRLRVKASASDSATVELTGDVVIGRRAKELFELAPESEQVAADATEKLKVKLSRGEARRARHRIRRGKRVEAHFDGSAVDAAGNRGAAADFEARLVLE